jgi:hypothetical protein
MRTVRPLDDDFANLMVQQENDAFETTTNQVQSQPRASSLSSTASSSISNSTTQRPYPPVDQTGQVADHDRPYADYGHLNRQTIAEQSGFNLQPPLLSASSTATASNQPQPSIRLNTKSFAITSWTNVSKELVMNHIQQEFGIVNIQYICVCEEIGELNHRRHLHIQIILKEKVNKKVRFLDAITQTHCNYQVTGNDLAWNEYIKKDGNYIEFNEFKSTKKLGPKQWPSTNAASATSTPAQAQAVIPRTTKTTTMTVRAQAEERRQHRIAIYKQAVELAKTSVDAAMDLMEREMIEKYVEHNKWYERRIEFFFTYLYSARLLSAFDYVHLRAQRAADRRADIDKEYVWPNSFPDCTPQLRTYFFCSS